MSVFRVPKPRKSRRPSSAKSTRLARNRSPKKAWKRKPSEFARIYGSKARVAFVKSLPCVIGLTCWGKKDNAHVVSGGAGRKADARFIVPLCHWHHHLLHQHGKGFFVSVDLEAAAADTERAWQNRCAQIEQQRASLPTLFHKVGADSDGH